MFLDIKNAIGFNREGQFVKLNPGAKTLSGCVQQCTGDIPMKNGHLSMPKNVSIQSKKLMTVIQ